MKVLCPRHEDSNPSVEVYHDGGYCFSGCGFIPLDELKLSKAPGGHKYVENVHRSLRRIRDLPLSDERRVLLPRDEKGLYVVYPGVPYYKLRLHVKPEKGDRYRSPSGHTQPLFVAREARGDTLVVVEGEINALSLAEALPEYTVVSPGGVGNFDNKWSERWKNFYKKYRKALVNADRDAPGAIAGMALCSFLRGIGCDANIKLWERDANTVLMEDGKEALRKEVEADLGRLGMSSRL